jgi:hypothetical protein
MKPAVTDPSHMPRMNRVTKRPAKLLQADVQANVMPQTKILTLVNKVSISSFSWDSRNTYLIHLPTGNRWSPRFCGNSKSK